MRLAAPAPGRVPYGRRAGRALRGCSAVRVDQLPAHPEWGAADCGAGCTRTPGGRRARRARRARTPGQLPVSRGSTGECSIPRGISELLGGSSWGMRRGRVAPARSSRHGRRSGRRSRGGAGLGPHRRARTAPAARSRPVRRRASRPTPLAAGQGHPRGDGAGSREPNRRKPPGRRGTRPTRGGVAGTRPSRPVRAGPSPQELTGAPFRRPSPTQRPPRGPCGAPAGPAQNGALPGAAARRGAAARAAVACRTPGARHAPRARPATLGATRGGEHGAHGEGAPPRRWCPFVSRIPGRVLIRAAEAVGFEPTEVSPPLRFSRPLPSAARARLQVSSRARHGNSLACDQSSPFREPRVTSTVFSLPFRS